MSVPLTSTPCRGHLRFRQGFGRLIRSRSDRGVVVVLEAASSARAMANCFIESLRLHIEAGALAQIPRDSARWIDGG